VTTSIAESFSTERPNLDTVIELSRRTDPTGVLSIYLDARPGTLRAASIDIKNRLAELRRRVAGDGPAERVRLVQDGLVRLDAEIERLIDPEEPGRGRILFAALEDGWLTRVATQLPLSNRVVLDRGPFIHPLLELLDEGAPAGVVLASRSEARLFEWRLGELTLLRTLEAELAEPGQDRPGPVGSRPARRYGTPTGERRKARERAQAARFVERVAAVTSRLAHDHSWDRVLVSAGERQTDSLVEALPPTLCATALRDPRVLLRLDLRTLEDIVTERLRDTHRAVERRLIGQVRAQAQQADAAALGLSEVVGALNQARVAHLVYDPFVRYRGSVGRDGSLYAGDERTPTYDSTPDERLTERLVERALETGARVTPVEGAAGDGLRDASGIAALLRW
jgi:hypothetical protein